MLLGAIGVHFTPLTIAAVLAWILCVCVHEFSHAVVAYFGGDTTVRDKGYLSLDFTRFIDPFGSLLLPAIVLMMGGLPLPGGAVMIDQSRLRSERWRIYTYAAGPASNLILFLLLAAPLHPLLRLVDPEAETHPTWVYFLGAMATLNFIGALFNLLPVPPLDGYGMIEHQFSHEMQWKIRQPQNTLIAFGVLFFVIASSNIFWRPFWYMLGTVSSTLGLPLDVLVDGYRLVLFGVAPGGG